VKNGGAEFTLEQLYELAKKRTSAGAKMGRDLIRAAGMGR
jgi:hypothetical protein